eukprot:1190828-Prorocentrum_minimum.AAC.7
MRGGRTGRVAPVRNDVQHFRHRQTRGGSRLRLVTIPPLSSRLTSITSMRTVKAGRTDIDKTNAGDGMGGSPTKNAKVQHHVRVEFSGEGQTEAAGTSHDVPA